MKWYVPDAALDGNGQVFESRNDAMATNISSNVNYIVTGGYYNYGDGGGAQYKRVGSEPSHIGKFQSADGSWFEYILGDSLDVRSFGAVDNIAVDSTTAIQGAIDFMNGKYADIFIGGKYQVSNIQVNYANINFRFVNAEMLVTDVFEVTATGCIVEAVNSKMRGTYTNTYSPNKFIIYVHGSSYLASLNSFSIRGMEMYDAGSDAIRYKWVSKPSTINCHIHNCGYAGVMHLSCFSPVHNSNEIHDITPGTGGNSYGVSFSHDNSVYPSANNPFTDRAQCHFNLVYNIAWEGIDAHGGSYIFVSFNKVYATGKGIAVTGSSGAATNYCGSYNEVVHNLVDGRNIDGTVSGYENTGYGINMQGGTIVNQANSICDSNIVLYKGIPSNVNVGAIQVTLADNVTVTSNTVRYWKGVAILADNASGTVANNLIADFLTGVDTRGYCISGTNSRSLNVATNTYMGSNPANIGYYMGAGTSRPVLTGNNFFATTTPYQLVNPGFCLGSDVTPIVTDTGSTTDCDISALQGWNGTVYLSNASPRSINTFTGARTGQKVHFLNSGAGAQTFTRVGPMLLNASSNQVLSTNYQLELYFTSPTTPRQRAPLSANG